MLVIESTAIGDDDTGLLLIALYDLKIELQKLADRRDTPATRPYYEGRMARVDYLIELISKASKS